MIEIDPLEQIEFFRDMKRAKEEARRKEAEAWAHVNQTVVTSGRRLVNAGLDQTELLAKMWASTFQQVALVKRAGISSTGRREERVRAHYDTLEIVAHPILLPGRLYAVMRLRAKEHARGRGFHDHAEEHGFDDAIKSYVAPDICEIEVYENGSQKGIASSWLASGDFTSFDSDFSDAWMRSSNPFSKYEEYHCEAQRGLWEPSTTLEDHPMTEAELVYGAGKWAVHSAWLHEIEQHITRS